MPGAGAGSAWTEKGHPLPPEWTTARRRCCSCKRKKKKKQTNKQNRTKQIEKILCSGKGKAALSPAEANSKQGKGKCFKNHLLLPEEDQQKSSVFLKSF